MRFWLTIWSINFSTIICGYLEAQSYEYFTVVDELDLKKLDFGLVVKFNLTLGFDCSKKQTNIGPPIFQYLSPLLSSSIFIKIHASHIKSNDKIDIANLIIGHVRYRNFDWRDGVCCDTWRRFGSTLLYRKFVSNRIEENLNHIIHIILPISTEKNWTFSVLIGSVFTTDLKLELRISWRVTSGQKIQSRFLWRKNSVRTNLFIV